MLATASGVTGATPGKMDQVAGNRKSGTGQTGRCPNAIGLGWPGANLAHPTTRSANRESGAGWSQLSSDLRLANRTASWREWTFHFLNSFFSRYLTVSSET